MAYAEPASNMGRLSHALAATRMSSGRPDGPMPGSAKTSSLPTHADASPAAIRLARLAASRKEGPNGPLVQAIIAATRGGTPYRPAPRPRPMALPPELLQMMLQGGPQPGALPGPMGVPPGMPTQ